MANESMQPVCVRRHWRATRRGAFVMHAARAVVLPTFKLYFRLAAEGLERIPDGPAVLAPNHVSFLDPFVLQAVLRRRVFFMVTSDFFDLKRFRWFLRLIDCIRVDEQHPNRLALRDAREVLRERRLLGIFPEGSISLDGRVHPGLPGVAALMMGADVPVIPVGIDGTYRALHRKASFPRPVKVTVRFGEPISLAASVAKVAGRKAQRERLTERLMTAIAALARAPRAPSESESTRR